MNKFVTHKDDLLRMFTDVTKSHKEDVEPVLDKALDNFQREMSRPIGEYDREDTPDEIKSHIFSILTKHFVLCLMNEKTFMQGNIKEITKRIDDLTS